LFVELEIAEMVRQDVIALRAPFRQHVHYFACDKCGRNIGFNDARLERALEWLAESRLWQVTHHRVELVGQCATCLMRADITQAI
jgi:Fe2+ or Zn2+ uptake regulation protein